MVAVHAAVSWLNRHEPQIKQRRMLELHLHREQSANYRKVRDGAERMHPTRVVAHVVTPCTSSAAMSTAAATSPSGG